jgi:hypothetical protein
MIDINFEWTRAFKYECVASAGRRRIKSVGRKREKLEPLKIDIDAEKPLYLRFAKLDGSEESCLRFAHHWGLLQSESPTAEEALDDWQQQIQAMRQAVSMFGSEGDLPPEIRRKLRAGEAWKLTSLDVLLVPTSAETKRFAMVLQPRNLISAMHLQLAKSVAGGGSIRSCKQCGDWFECGASDSRRNIAIFCSEKCKNRFHYLERAKQ